MPVQQNAWSCSVYSYRWVIQALGIDRDLSYDDALQVIGYPSCVNPTYGLMSAQAMHDAFSHYGLQSRQVWASYDEAYAICREHTGTINPKGMYHFMGIRGTDNGELWVANSAPNYMGVGDHLDRSQFNSLGPVSLIYLS